MRSKSFSCIIRKMDVGDLSISAAAVISYSTHHLLFLKTSDGEELSDPACLPTSATTTAVYGNKRCTSLPPTACCKVPVGDNGSHEYTRYAPYYSRAGVEVIPRKKRELLGWRRPTEEDSEYIKTDIEQQSLQSASES